MQQNQMLVVPTHNRIGSFVVSGLEPWEEKVTKKVGKIKLVEYRRGVSIGKRTQRMDFKTYMLTIRSQIVNSVQPLVQDLPSWFNAEEYLEKSWSHFMEAVEKDKDLKKCVEKLTNQPDLSDRRTFLMYKETLDIIYDRLCESLPKWEIANSYQFLESDLPISFFTTRFLSYQADLHFFYILKRRAVKLMTQMNIASNFRRFSLVIQEYKNEMRQLVEARQKVWHSEERLNFYVRISNAQNIEEMFKIIPLKTKNLDGAKFNALCADFDLALDNLLKMFMQYGREMAFEPSENDISQQFRQDLARAVINIPA